MNTSFLYRYLISPFKTITEFGPTYSPRLEAMIVLTLLGIAHGAQMGGHYFIVLGFLFVLLGAFFILVQTLIFDFTAQALGGQAQTVRLYYWLALSGLPLLLKLPLSLVQNASLSLNLGVVTLVFVLSCFVAGLQVFTLKTLYQISTRRALFVYFIPLIAVVGVVGILVIITTFFSVMLIKGL